MDAWLFTYAIHGFGQFSFGYTGAMLYDPQCHVAGGWSFKLRSCHERLL